MIHKVCLEASEEFWKITSLVKCSNFVFMVKSIRNLTIENMHFTLCFEKAIKKAHITSEAKNSGIVKVECNKEVISKIINTVYFNVRKIFL